MAFGSPWFGSSKDYATLNPSSATDSADMTLSEGNLRVATTTNSRTLTATMATGSTTGYYFEIKAISYATDGGVYLGLTSQATNNDAFAVSYIGFDTYAGTYRTPAADDTNNFSGTNVTSNNDVWQVAFDAINRKFWIGKNNTWADGVTPSINGSGNTTLTAPTGALYPFISRGGSYNETYQFNFGATAFAHTPPSGFISLNSSTSA